jgi:hypothetical protein
MIEKDLNEIFQFYIEGMETVEGAVNKAEFSNINFDISKATGRFIQGYASTPAWDSDGESIVKSGLDITYYNNQGWLNWMHNNQPEYIIGIPVYSKIDSIGFFTKGMLFKNNEKANHVWNLAKELASLGNPRKLGFSIEGKVVQRSAINKSKIIKAKVTNVAVTHIPVNTEATFELVSKSFVPAQYDEIVSYIAKDLQFSKDLGAIASPGMTTAQQHVSPGDTGSGTLQVESLEGSGKSQTVKNVVVGNPSDPELEKRLLNAYRDAQKSRNDLISLMKAVHPEASDVLLERISELIFRANGIENFVNILNNSDVLGKN